ncbi:MAG TPA: HAD-IA family hydrolase [Phototrophicaceae bacterium]|nr:HAD-IA family hydrolase [Phototrophicaceae bacterium]
MATPTITTLFLDIGGVLLTNGWDHGARKRAADVYHLDYTDIEERHHLSFDTYEEGKLSLDEYLAQVIFYEPRAFSSDEFKAFMQQQSQPFPDTIQLIKDVKQRYGLKVASVNNEGRELMRYRIDSFDLRSVFDYFIASSYVHFRKPDADIWRVALDIAQADPSQVLYIEDRPLFVQIAKSLGMNAVRHENTAATKAMLAQYGLSLD